MNEVDGWMSDEEGQLLKKLASQVPADKDIVELGSYKGLSSICLVRDEGDLYCVDTFEGDALHLPKHSTLDAFKERTKGLNLKAVISTTDDFSNEYRGTIGLIYIDANHSYEGVSSDFVNYLPFYDDDTFIVFHDVYEPRPPYEWNKAWPGVPKFYRELLKTGEYEEIARKHRIGVLKKVCKEGETSDNWVRIR